MKAMRMSKQTNRQTGAALIIGLILIAIASIGAVATMRGSHLQDRMASNHLNQVIAHMAAEAKAARFLMWLDSVKNEPCGNPPVWRDDWKNDPVELGLIARTGSQIPLLENGAVFFPPHGHAWIDTTNPDPNPDWLTNPGKVTVTVTGAAVNDGDILAESHMQMSAQYACGTNQGGNGGNGEEQECPNAGRPHQAFWVGMLAGGNISARGTFTGTVHANGNASLSGTLNDRTVTNDQGQTETLRSQVTAGGTATMGSTADDRVKSGQPVIEVPSARAFVQDYVAQNATTPNPRFVELPVRGNKCDFPPAGANACSSESGILNCGGMVFYCSKTLETKGSFRNATLMGLEGVEHSGSSTFGTRGE